MMKIAKESATEIRNAPCERSPCRMAENIEQEPLSPCLFSDEEECDNLYAASPSPSPLDICPNVVHEKIDHQGDFKQTLFGCLKNFTQWLVTQSGKHITRCKELQTQVDKILDTVKGFEISSVLVLAQLIETNWLHPAKYDRKFSALTIKNYLYALTRFATYLDAKTDINMSKLHSNIDLWLQGLKKDVAIQRNERRIIQRSWYIFFVYCLYYIPIT